MRILAALVTLSFALVPVAVSAKQRAGHSEPPRLIISEKAVADALAAEQPVAREPRDSLKNGALVGAIIGGIALGGFVSWLCNALQEPSDPSCLSPSLLYIGVGAGIGAAAGAGIDALFSVSAPSPLRRDRENRFGSGPTIWPHPGIPRTPR